MVTLSGEIDLACADDLAAFGIATVGSARVQRIVLDLAAVSFLDSTAVGALLRIRSAALDQRKPFALRNPSDAARKVISLAGLNSVLPVELATPPPAPA